MRQVTLGSSGIRTSQLAIGTGTVGWAGSSNQTRLGFDDRKPLQAVRARISEINGEILMGIMAKKR